MTRYFQLAGASAALLALVAGTASAADLRQLAVSAGITAAQAANLTLEEIVALKFNHESEDDINIAVPRSASSRSITTAPAFVAAAGVGAEAAGMSFDEIHVSFINRSSDGDNRQTVVARRGGGGGDYTRLVRAAGLSDAQAASLTLEQIAVYKFNRNAHGDDVIPIRN